MQTVSELAAAFYTFMQTRNAPGTIGYYRVHLDRFAAHVGSTRIQDLRKHHLLTWGKTWHAMQAVQRLFNWAHVEAELIERNPFRGMRRPRLGNRKRVLSRSESIRLLRKTDAVFRRYLIALRETIARPQEIRDLRWEQIGWEGSHNFVLEAIAAGHAHFELHEFKSRTQRTDPDAVRVILINARMGRLLLRLASSRRGLVGPIFLNGQGKPWTTNALRLRMRRLCRRTATNKDTRGEPVVCYTFRHTSATDACVNGMPDRVLAELMGHTTTRTTARYQHLSRNHLRDAVNKMKKQRGEK